MSADSTKNLDLGGSTLTFSLSDPATVEIWSKVLLQDVSKPSLGLWTGFMFYESPVNPEPDVFVITRLY